MEKMQLPSSTKIEHRAINVLESIIDEHLTMEYQFNGNDKEMSWDGYIWLYKKNNGIQSKLNFDGRVSVQIKGHIDSVHKYLDCDKITYPVELNDLEAYATEKGVLYFQIFLDGQKKEIFYASLYPSKIADYLDIAKKKRNRSTYNVSFLKLKKSAETLYIVAKQFNDEATKQGSAYTPLVQDRIKCDDFDKLRSITLTVAGARNSYDALLRLSSGDICLYGKTEGDKYLRPMESLDHSKFFIGQEVYQDVSIGEEVFYSCYRCIADSDGGMVLILSPNLELRLTEGKFNFKVSSSLKELSKDAQFLLRLKDFGSYSIAGHEFKCMDSKISPDFQNRLRYILDLYETLEMIGFDLNVKLSNYTEEQQEQFLKLVNLRLGAYNSQLKDEFSKYVWTFGNKCVPLLIIKNGSKIELTSSVYTNKFVIFLPCAESNDARGYRMPLFVYQDIEILSNLYYYDYDAFHEQIDNSDANEVTSGALLECVLIMINVFDKNHDLHFLDLAEYLLQKLEPFTNEELILLNRLQIRKRRGTFSDTEINQLNSVKCDDIHILFGKSVLLGCKEQAAIYFQQFSEDDKVMYQGFPIYKLFEEL